jgi:hypothetical protein
MAEVVCVTVLVAVLVTVDPGPVTVWVTVFVVVWVLVTVDPGPVTVWVTVAAVGVWVVVIV